MHDHVLTLIGRPDAAAARVALQSAGGVCGTPDWLAPGQACDIPFAALAPAAAMAVAAQIGCDVYAQPMAGRRKRLLVADMESTMIANEMLDDLAVIAGIGPRIAEITRRAMNGEIDFEGALRERVGLLAGLPEAVLERAYGGVKEIPGGRTLVATMRAHGAYCALVSGGFTWFTGRVRQRLGFDSDQANVLEVADGTLVGTVREPILGRAAKQAALERLAAERGLTAADAVAVGDGANDLAMLQAAGLGVAFRAKPAVAAAARARVDHGDLTALLYLQGYRAGDFITA
jgi:phosphoserine phosphatase